MWINILVRDSRIYYAAKSGVLASSCPLSALRPNQKGTMDVMNSSAAVDKASVFLRSWIVNVFDR